MKNEMKININARLNVTEDVAEACLVSVAVYVNDTGKEILGHRREDGTMSFEFAEKLNAGKDAMEGITAADISKLKVDKLDPELMDKKIPRYTMNSGGDSYLAHFK